MGLEIEFTDERGQKVSQEQFVKNLADEVQLKGIQEHVRQSLVGIRCAEHDQTPRVKIRRAPGDKVIVNVEGCCDKLESEAAKALSI